MKTSIKTAGKTASFIVSIAIFLLLTACNNPFSPPAPDAPENGEAYVAIRMGNGDNARTLYPTVAFNKYELQFTPRAGQTAMSPVTITGGNSATVTLAHGSWTVTAIGYININGADEEAARGTGSLNVQAGSNRLTIELQPQKEEGTGILSYTIVYPTVSTASLKILPLLDDTPIEEKDLTESASGTITLDAGFYVLRLELKKADGGRIIKMEVIHIYHGLTTEASGAKYTFTDADFSYIFDVTFEDADGNHLYTEAVAKGALATDPGDLAVGVGEGLYLNFDPDSFEGWTEDGTTLYDFDTPVTDDITLTAKWDGGAPTPIPLSGAGTIVNQAVAYVNSNASSGAYTLFIDNDYTTAGGTLTANADLTIIGLEEERTLQWNGTGGFMFKLEGNNASLTLGDHITLKGTSGTSNQVVEIRNGTLAMEAGSIITGHTTSFSWGAVYVGTTTSYGQPSPTGAAARFIMNGGEITGNKSTSNTSGTVGGVYISSFGEVIVNGGRITGNTANPGENEHPADIFVYVSGDVSYSMEGNLTLSGEAEIGAVKLDGADAQYPVKSTFIKLDGYIPGGVTVIDLRRPIGSFSSITDVITYWTDGTKPVLQAAEGTLDPAVLNYFSLGRFFGTNTTDRRYINGNPSAVYNNYRLKLDTDGTKAVLEQDTTVVQGTTRASDFNITGLVWAYDGAPKTVTITPKSGMSDGAITIFYNGSLTAPSESGTYAVTFNVAESTNYMAAAGLSAGTLTIVAPVVVTTNADDGPGSLRQAIRGGAVSITIEPGVGTIALATRLVINSDITIMGNGVILTPTWTVVSNDSQLIQVTGSATATISRVHFKDGRAADYGAAIRVDNANLTLESCIVSGSRTSANGTWGGVMYATGANIVFKGCTFYDNSTPTGTGTGGVLYFGSTAGTITLMGNLFFGNYAYNNPIIYKGSAAATTVTSLGYNVTDVALGTANNQSGWTSVTGDTTFSTLGITTGAPFHIFTFEPQAALNSVIEYELAGFPITDFNGTHRTVPGAPGAVNSGAYVFEGYPVGAGDFNITGLVHPADGAPKAVSITPKPGKSTGAITIYYEGTGGTIYTKSTTAPSAAGTYAVTFDVAVASGFLAATGLNGGTLIIAAPVTISINADTGTGSLREAIETKLPAIIIAPSVGTIALASPLAVTGDVTLMGNGVTITPGASWPTTSNATQLMRVTAGVTATISGVHFKDGRATDQGAAINVDNANLTLESCIISGSRTSNTSTAGGAMWARQSTVALKGCTFFDNYSTATSSSGGVMYLNGTTNTVTLLGNLFYGNKASTSPIIYPNTSGNTVTSLGYNVIDVTTFGTSSSTNNQQSGWASVSGDTTLSALSITGEPFNPLTFEPQVGLNEVIEYTLSGFPATDFNGTTRTVPGAPGAVNSGSYVFAGYTVLAGDFTITGLTDLEDGNPKAVTITPLSGKSGGDRTIYYEGTGGTTYAKSTTAPSAAGTYAVTFDVAEVPGNFLEAIGLVAGTLVITAPTPLIADTWVYTTLTAGTDEHWYSFSVTNGVSYYVWWEDETRSGGKGTTGDIVIGARYEGETSWIFGGTNTTLDSNGWTTAQTINANRTGTVQIRVIPYNRGQTNPNHVGSYGVAYSETNSRPALP